MDEAETRELIDLNLRKIGWEADTKLLNAKIHKTQPEEVVIWLLLSAS